MGTRSRGLSASRSRHGTGPIRSQNRRWNGSDPPEMPSPTARPRRERGVVIVYLAFFIVVILGFLSLAVDGAKLVATRTQLQRAADAAALAGVSAIDLETGTIIPDTAVARAQETAALNKAFSDGPTSVVVAPGDVEFP